MGERRGGDEDTLYVGGTDNEGKETFGPVASLSVSVLCLLPLIHSAVTTPLACFTHHFYAQESQLAHLPPNVFLHIFGDIAVMSIIPIITTSSHSDQFYTSWTLIKSTVVSGIAALPHVYAVMPFVCKDPTMGCITNGS